MALLFAAILSTLCVFSSAQIQAKIPNLQMGDLSCSRLYNNLPNQCRAPGRIVEAWVAEQTTGTCRIYTTFGFVANYLWVRNDCGGRFTIVYQPSAGYSRYPYPNGPWVNPTNNCQTGEVNTFCFNTSPSSNVCRVPLLVEKVTFRGSYTGYTSAGPCQENYGYGKGQNRTTIWTNRGCQGTFDVTFQVCPVTSQTGCRSFTTAMRCGNGGYPYTECSVPVQVTNVRLLRNNVFGGANACVENVSYGLAADGVRVSQGCRGEFALSYRICNAAT